MKRPSARRVVRGFTLIELMITVAVVAILASIALPAYRDSIVKGKRAQGRSALLELMTQQERYLTQNGSYLTFAAGAVFNSTTATDATGATNVSVPFKTFSGDSGIAPTYKLGARACAAGTLRSCVQVFATPQFSDSAIAELNITSTGAKDCNVNTGASKTLCWN